VSADMHSDSSDSDSELLDCTVSKVVDAIRASTAVDS